MWDQLDMRQYDRLPAFAVTIEDNDGKPVPLDYLTMRATAIFVGHHTGLTFTGECAIVPSMPGVITHDWQPGGVIDYPDTYDVSVTVNKTTGEQAFTAPSRRDCLLVIRPFAPLNADTTPPPDNEPVYWDDVSLLTRWDDPSNNFRWRP